METSQRDMLTLEQPKHANERDQGLRDTWKGV